MIRPWMKPICVVLSWTMLIFSLPVPAVAQQNVREAQGDGQMVKQSTQGTGKLVVVK